MIQKPHNFGWCSVFHKAFSSGVYQNIESFIDSELKAGKKIFPSVYDIFEPFNYKSPEDIKVVILGQDPYHTPGHAHGFAFSSRVTNKKEWPPSLRNIFKVIKADTGSDCHNAYLGSWAFQGVLLLNTCLTVEQGKPNSHQDLGWDIIIDTALNYLSSTNRPVVYMLWGEHAKEKRHIIKDNPHQIVLESSHPSPFSVHKGFMFCKHFSTANKFLESNGLKPINWGT